LSCLMAKYVFYEKVLSGSFCGRLVYAAGCLYGDGRFVKLELNALVYLNPDGVIINAEQPAVQATNGDHVHPLLQFVSELLLVLGLFLLWPDHEEIKHQNDHPEEQDVGKSTSP
jgi:hypothetical protein